MSERYQAGFITKTTTTPTGPYASGAAPGVWTLDQQLQYQKQGVWPTAGFLAPYVEDVFSTYLYNGNASSQGIENGIDLGPDTGNNSYFNGGQINTNTSASAFSLGTSDWTVECWLKSTYTSRIDPYELNGGTDASSGFFGLTLNRTASGQIEWNEAVSSSASPVISATGTSIVNGSWHHVAITRSGNAVRLFLDGTQVGSTYSTSYTYGSANKNFRFGNRYPGGISSGSNYYISNFRIVKGTALYTSSFTPPTQSLTQVSGTSYLGHQSLSTLTDTTGIGNSYTNSVTPGGTGPFNYGTGKGGMVWLKSRSNGDNHGTYDTARGVGNYLIPNSSGAQGSAEGVSTFNSTGFTLGSVFNDSGKTYVSWTFRKQEKFFDVVTYTGTGSARTVSHNLGSAPGFIIIKRTDAADEWFCYHRSLSANNVIYLNLTNATNTASNMWNNTAPTSTVFTVGTDTGVNGSGRTYVAYLFAHDAGGFGASGTDNVISCGSYTGTGAAGNAITLGYEPQWLLIKRSSTSGNDWWLMDSMRGLTMGIDADLRANLSQAEENAANYANPTATGFTVETTNAALNASGSTYIYIAIRRGPMRTPTSGTSVFSTVTYTGDGNANRQIGTTITPDLSIVKARTNNTVPMWADRLRGQASIYSSATAAETNPATGFSGGGQIIDTGVQSGIKILQGTTNVNNVNQSSITYVDWNFRRAPGFFDEVCFTTNGSGNFTGNHNLGATPELIITKRRDSAGSWWVYCAYSGTSPLQRWLILNDTGGASGTGTSWWATSSTSFSVLNGLLAASATNVAYLFSSVTGVSKIGSYTGTAAAQQINCGFTGGARFVLIKRTDTDENWYVWDSSRGIVAANDPYLVLNSTATEVTNTDYIDTYSAGFEISATSFAGVNANGGTYIFLAIA